MAMVRRTGAGHDPFIVLPMHKRRRKGSQAGGAEAVHGSSCDEDVVQLFFMFFFTSKISLFEGFNQTWRFLFTDFPAVFF